MEEERFVKLISTESFAEAEQLLQVLKENGIASFRQGGIMDVYLGNSPAGEDIMVLEKDQEKALEILESCQPIKVNALGKRRSFSKSQSILSGILLIMIIVICFVLPIIL